MSIREEEDSAAVIEAVADGIATTEETPLALLLDNKPSNHTSDVKAALDDVPLPLRATTVRPQNKAHVEGGFGLFQQAVPALDLRGTTPRGDLEKVCDSLIAAPVFVLNLGRGVPRRCP
jgi:hypothetical protein